MKKALIYGLSVAMLLGSLTACGKPQADQQADQSAPSQAAVSTPAPEAEETLDTSPAPEETTKPNAAPEQTAQATTEPLSGTTTAAPDGNENTQPPEEEASPKPDEETAPEIQLFTDCEETVYATGAVNIRSSWSASSDKLGSLSRGESVTRTGTSIAGTEADGWSRVRLADGTTAYISNQYLSTTKPDTQNTNTGNQGGDNTTPTPSATGGSTTQTQPSTGSQSLSSLSGEDIANALRGMHDSGGYVSSEGFEHLTPEHAEAIVQGLNNGGGY